MTPPDNTPDDQDQSETFDETHIDDEGEGDVLPDQADPVLDVTQKEGDAGEEDDDLDEIQTLQRADPDGRVESRPDEIELVYDGLGGPSP